MLKTIVFILAFLVLLLLAVNVRLEDRTRDLEERLAAAERRRAPKAAAKPAPGPEQAVSVAEPVPTTPIPPAATAPVPASRIEAAKPPSPENGATVGRFLNENLSALQVLIEGDQLQVKQLVLRLQNDDPPPPEGRKPGYLGISGGDAAGGGAQVTDVFPTGVAGGAGLRAGDVIVEYNGESVQGLADLARRVRESGEGAPVSLRIRRDGNEFYQGVQLGSRP